MQSCCYAYIFFLDVDVVAVVNGNGNGNENVKKTIDLDQQNNNFARASRFFARFFDVTAQLRRERYLISRFAKNDAFFLFLNFDRVV